MQTQPEKNFDGAVKKQKNRKRWQKIVSTLVCIVVFCTTYALILPAITISAEVNCALEPHLHGDDCYELIEHTLLSCLPGHKHSEACYDGEGNTICGCSELVLHQHNEFCYDGEGNLCCSLEELEFHAHSPACYTQTEDGAQTLVCTRVEAVPHEHSDACFDADGVMSCGMVQLPVHNHTEDCVYISYTHGELLCQLPEHVHDESCYENFPTEVRASMLFSLSSTDADTTSSLAGSTSILDVDAKFEVSYTNTSFDPNDETYDVNLKLSYDLNKEVFEKVKAGTYDAFHIVLPDKMIIPDDLLNVVRSATDSTKDGMVAFDYWFEKTSDGKYVIHIEYREEYVDRMVADNSDGQSEINFSGTVDKSAVTDDGDLKLTWSDGTTTTIGKEDITYPDNETLNYDIFTHKQGSYNVVDDTLTYTVKVFTEKGTPPGNTITVTDVMTLNGITLSGDPTVTVKDASGNTVSGASTSYSNSGSPTITVSNLPALGAGGYYTITYTYKINELSAGEQHWPNNTVTAQVPNPENDDPLKSTTSTSVHVSKEMIGKVGTFDAENGMITWTITVNAAKDNIAGYVLTDDMLQNALSLSIVPADTSSYTINRDANNKISSITFLGDTNGSNTNTYTITYTTAQDQSTTGGYTSNNAVLTPPEGSSENPSNTGDVNVWVPADGGIDKEFVSRDGGVMNWSIVLEIPEGGIGAGTVIKDNTGYSWDYKAENHWMTPKQITELNDTLSELFSGVDYTLEFSSDGWNWDTYAEAIADTDTNKYYCWRITFNEDVPSLANQNITINYSTTADLNAVTSTATYVNSVSMGDYKDTASTEYKPNVAKLDRYYNSGTTNISSTDGLIGWYVRITPDTEKSQIIVTDYLPAGVTLTKIGVGSDGNAAKGSTGYTGAGTETLYGWENLMATYNVSTYQDTVSTTGSDGTVTETQVNAQQVVVTVSSSVTDSSIPANKDVYVYFECTIDNMPAAGSTANFTFKNEATVDGIEVEQTQNVTVTIPATVVKMDRDGSTGDTTHSYNEDDPTVGWYVRVYLPDGATDLKNNPIIVTDTLPTGLKLSKIGTGASMYDARYGKDYSTNPATDLVVTVGESLNGSIGGAYSGSYAISGQTITVSIDNNDTNIDANSYIYIYLECKITKDAVDTDSSDATETYKFPNSVNVTVGGNDHGSDEHTQEVVKSTTNEQKAVDKSSNWDSGINQLQYTLLLNETGADLDADSGSVQVVDQMIHAYDRWWNTKHSTLIASSVKLYYAKLDDNKNVLYDSNGVPLTDGEVPADQWSWTYSDNYEDVLNYQSDQIINTLTLSIPDGRAVVLKYIYEFSVDAEWDTSFVVTNKATVYGDTVTTDEVSTNDTWKYSSVSASATSSGTYTIHKVKEGNYNVVLPGAEFTVYDFSTGQPLTDASGNVVVYTTDENGLIKITHEEWFAYDKVYYITETKAPAGYSIAEDSPTFYFYFSKDTTLTYQIPDGAIDLSITFGVGYVENEIHENQITVTKKWMDSNGATITAPQDSITFQLIQTDIYGNEVIYYPNATDGMTDAEKVYTISSGNNWELTLEHLPQEDAYGNPYTYTAREIEVTGYVSEVSVDANGNITISNRKETTGSVTVKKEWSGGASGDSVTVQLYQAVDVIRTKYTAYLCFADGDWNPQIGTDTLATFTKDVTGAGAYTITWSMQDFGFQKTDGIKTLYIDIFDPYSEIYNYYTLKSLSVSVNGSAVALVDGASPKLTRSYDGLYTRIQIHDGGTNFLASEFSIAETGSLAVTFELEAKDSGHQLAALSYRDVANNVGGITYRDPQTLSEANDWQCAWDDLPLTGTDENGHLVEYSYYVVETTKGYDVTYDNQEAIKSGTIRITNSPRTPVDIVVDKIWSDGNTTIPAPVDSVEVDLYTLYQFGVYAGAWGSGDYTNILDIVRGSEITINFIGASDAMVKTSGWNEPPSDWKLTKSDNIIGYCPVKWVNTENNTEGYNYVPIYEWTLYIPSAIPESINICSKVAFGEYELYTDDSGSIKNGVTQKVEITGMTLTHPTDYESNHSIWNHLGTYTISAADSWQLTIPDLAAGTYKLVEKNTGYTISYTADGTATNKSYAVVTPAEGSQSNVTITNTTATTKIHVEKVWKDNGERVNVDMITFTLYQYTANTDDAVGVEYGTYTIYMQKVGDSYVWKTTITDLPLSYTDENGASRPYYYAVEENPIPGYSVRYEDEAGKLTGLGHYYRVKVQGDGTLYMINEATTEIGVVKEWAEGTTPGKVQVTLYQVYTPAGEGVTGPTTSKTGGVPYVKDGTTYTVTLGEGASEGKDKTWRRLPLYKYDNNGNVIGYYSYYVVEDSNGYIATYSTNESITSGSITITNKAYTTSISVLKQWVGDLMNTVDVNLYRVYHALDANHTHSYTSEAVAPTCTSQGYTKKTCTGCGIVLMVDLTDPVGHDYKFTSTTAPTCTEQGYTTYTCDDCGATTVGSYVAATGHNWDAGVVTKAPTDTENGVKTYTCTVDGCGATRTEVISSTHVHSYSTVVTAPTCEAQGYTTYTCACGSTYKDNYVEATGHSYGNWTTVKEATCIEEGSQKRTCSKCGKVDTQTLQKVAHTYSEFVVTTAATCTAAGEKTQTCTVEGCGATNTQIIAALGHTPGEAVKENEAADGSYDSVVYCTVCDAEISRTEVSGSSDGDEDGSIALWSGTHVATDDSNYLTIDLPSDFEFNSDGYLEISCYPTIGDSANVYVKAVGYGDALGWSSINGAQKLVITYEQFLSACYGSTTNLNNVSEIRIGYNITITEVTWVYGTSSQSLSLSDTVFNTVTYSDGTGGTALSGELVYENVKLTPGELYTWSDLPLYVVDPDTGDIVGYYTYYVVETGGVEYDATYTYTNSAGAEVTLPSMTEGIKEGTIVITNTHEYHYELPSTGGSGTGMYTLGGIALLIGAAFVLLYNHKKGRKGAVIP